MRLNTIRTAALSAIILAGAAVTGCQSKPESERTLEHAKVVEDAGHMMARGEDMVREGKAMQARGKAAKEQGDTVEGARQINEGELMQRNGEAAIEQARKAKAAS